MIFNLVSIILVSSSSSFFFLFFNSVAFSEMGKSRSSPASKKQKSELTGTVETTKEICEVIMTYTNTETDIKWMAA